MSRPPRYSYAHAVHHVTQRCNNREFLFDVPSFDLYCAILREARTKFPLRLYDYCLMTNHVHLLIQVGRADTLSEAMHWINCTFSRRFNRRTGRRGHLWEARYRSTIVHKASYLLRCMAYVDLNPVRARMVSTPLEYRWSGHRALRDESGEVDLSAEYLALGSTHDSRYQAYSAVLREEAMRPPMTLADVLFVGTPHFAYRMEKRFFKSRRNAAITQRKLDGGVVCTAPDPCVPARSNGMSDA